MKKLRSLWFFLAGGLCTAALLGLVAAGAAWYWTTQTAVPMQTERIEYTIAPGASTRQVARAMQQAGIHVNGPALVVASRFAALDTQLKTGVYAAQRGDTLWQLLQRMAHGQMVQRQWTLVEGWRWPRILQALQAHPDIRQTLDGQEDNTNTRTSPRTETRLRQQLGIEQDSLEGWFYPDSYRFAPGTREVDILRLAYQKQRETLDELWAQRTPGLPLQTPYEALILASIVEKETGHAPDRARVAGVFINRLRRGMPLQTDPTVIYGMQDNYQGRLRRRDLATDTPWNTYTRRGLPPTPIASPGRAALQAVLAPEMHGYLYFVARGDGTSEFSENLSAHNRAVQHYILGREP